MQIHSLHQAHAASSISRSGQPQAAGTSESASKVNSAVDQLDLSAEAQQISQTQASGPTEAVTNGIRTEKVAALRQAIADGSYETPEKLSAALDQLLDSFA